MHAEQLVPAAPLDATTRRRSAVRSAAVAVGAFAIVLSLVRLALNDPPQKGPTGSSFATTNGGLAAFAELARRDGHNVRRFTSDLSTFGARRDTTIVVAGATLTDDQADAIREEVYSGARLIAEVGPGQDWLTRTYSNVTWVSYPPELEGEPIIDSVASGIDGVRRIRQRISGFFMASPRDFDIILDRNDLVQGIRFADGAGEVIALADTSMLSNELLDEEDNAAFGLALLDGRPTVQFIETPHGYNDAKLSPTGLPWRMKWFAGGLFFATICWMWSRGRRNGPPESLDRELDPPRSMYLDGMTAVLAKSDRRRPWRTRNRQRKP